MPGAGSGRANSSATAFNADPYTGTAAAAGRGLMYVPHSAGFLTFDAAQYDGIAKKLAEFNAQVPQVVALSPPGVTQSSCPAILSHIFPCHSLCLSLLCICHANC